MAKYVKLSSLVSNITKACQEVLQEGRIHSSPRQDHGGGFREVTRGEIDIRVDCVKRLVLLINILSSLLTSLQLESWSKLECLPMVAGNVVSKCEGLSDSVGMIRVFATEAQSQCFDPLIASRLLASQSPLYLPELTTDCIVSNRLPNVIPFTRVRNIDSISGGSFASLI